MRKYHQKKPKQQKIKSKIVESAFANAVDPKSIQPKTTAIPKAKAKASQWGRAKAQGARARSTMYVEKLG